MAFASSTVHALRLAGVHRGTQVSGGGTCYDRDFQDVLRRRGRVMSSTTITAASPLAVLPRRIPTTSLVRRVARLRQCRAPLLRASRGRSLETSSATTRGSGREPLLARCAGARSSSVETEEASAAQPPSDPEQSQLLVAACAVGLLTGAAVSGFNVAEHAIHDVVGRRCKLHPGLKAPPGFNFFVDR